MNTTQVRELIAAGVSIHAIEQQAEWEDISLDYLNRRRWQKRYVEFRELGPGLTDPLFCKSGMGGVFRLQFLGRTDDGKYEFVIDNARSSFHGRRLQCEAEEVVNVVWIERQIPLGS